MLVSVLPRALVPAAGPDDVEARASTTRIRSTAPNRRGRRGPSPEDDGRATRGDGRRPAALLAISVCGAYIARFTLASVCSCRAGQDHGGLIVTPPTKL